LLNCRSTIHEAVTARIMQYIGELSCVTSLINDVKERFYALNHAVAFRNRLTYWNGFRISMEIFP